MAFECRQTIKEGQSTGQESMAEIVINRERRTAQYFIEDLGDGIELANGTHSWRQLSDGFAGG
jgi:hypothetical protein